MKLAEALLERADCQRRITQTTERLKRVALVQEGLSPAEDPQDLRRQLDEMLARLQFLMCAINHTNAIVEATPGVKMTEALAERDVLKQRLTLSKGVLDAAQMKIDRYSKTEIRFISTLDVKELQTEYDGHARRLRELDTRIQEANWKFELIKMDLPMLKTQGGKTEKPDKDKKLKTKK